MACMPRPITGGRREGRWLAFGFGWWSRESLVVNGRGFPSWRSRWIGAFHWSAVGQGEKACLEREWHMNPGWIELRTRKRRGTKTHRFMPLKRAEKDKSHSDAVGAICQDKPFALSDSS